MSSIRALHAAADKARANYWLWLYGEKGLSHEEVRARYETLGAADRIRDEACKRLDVALSRYDNEKTVENYDELVAAVVACYTTDQDTLTIADELHSQ